MLNVEVQLNCEAFVVDTYYYKVNKFEFEDNCTVQMSSFHYFVCGQVFLMATLTELVKLYILWDCWPRIKHSGSLSGCTSWQDHFDL